MEGLGKDLGGIEMEYHAYQSISQWAECLNIEQFCDLPGAFLHMLKDEKINMVLRGELCELMWCVDPKLYRKYICRDKREACHILKTANCTKLIGLMKSALLFYKK